METLTPPFTVYSIVDGTAFVVEAVTDLPGGRHYWVRFKDGSLRLLNSILFVLNRGEVAWR